MRLSVKELSYHYDNFRLFIEGLNFAGNRVTSIVGPNGAGKSTLLKCLSSVLPIARATVFVEDEDIADLTSRKRARAIGYVPQEPSFTFNYTVLDFVLTGRAAFISLFSSPSDHDRELAEEALHYVGLDGYGSRPFLELSSGERRLVLISRSLAQRSEILLLDEPTSFLDPRHEVETMELLRRLAEEREKTIIVTLHNLDMAVKYSDAMVFMKNGRVAASGSPDEILSEDLLKRVYDIEMKIITLEGRRLILR